MTPIAGERDNLILNANPRFAPARDKALILDPDASQFHVIATSTNTAEPSEIHFTAKLINMGDAVATFSTSDGSTLSVTGNTATLKYVNMASPETTVTASVVYEGRTYTSSKVITRSYDGTTGEDGLPGDSARVCYSKTALNNLSSSPATITTSGPSSYPPPGTWGADTVWVGSPPSFGAGENLFRSDGTFSPETGVTTWRAPYLNALKVGQLSAITANLGSITSGDIYGTVLHGGLGYPTGAYAWPTNSSGGFHLSEQGLLLGNFTAGRYFQVEANGNLYAPRFQIVNGVATFAGNVNTGTGTAFRIEMGPDDPVYAMWAGSGAKTDNNAIFYLKRNGSAYFGGSLSAGTLRTAVTNPSLDANAQVIDGPFGTNGGPINVVCSYSYVEQTSRDGGQWSMSGPENSATIQLYRTIEGSAEALVQTLTVSGTTTLGNSDDPTEQSFYQREMGGSVTYTDTAGGSLKRTYRAVIASRYLKTVTFVPAPGGGPGNSSQTINQALTIVTTE